MSDSPSSHPQFEDDSIDFAEPFSRLKRGLPLIADLAVAALAYFTAGSFRSVTTATRVVFSFPGFET